MPESKDIVTRVVEGFIDEVRQHADHNKLAEPLKGLLNSGRAPKPASLVEVYEQSIESSDKGEQTQ